MAVYLYTDDPQALLDAFKEAIDEGSVDTWSYDKDDDFTHDAPEWESEAWFRPRLTHDALVLNIVSNTTTILTTEVYAVYHGRIVESFLAHFDTHLRSITTSSFPELEDIP